MTRKEFNKMRMQVYKDFIQQKYGKEQVDKLELAVNIKLTDKMLEMRSNEEFCDALNELVLDSVE